MMGQVIKFNKTACVLLARSVPGIDALVLGRIVLILHEWAG
jgi:hypothetical protein